MLRRRNATSTWGIGSASTHFAMYEHDEDDPKRPRPVRNHKKRSNAAESAESRGPLRKDDDRDRHRHVV